MPQEPSDFRRLFEACRRHALLVFVSGVIGVAAAGVVVATMQPRYDAVATVFVTGAPDARQPLLGLQQATLAQTLVPSYAQLAQTRSIATAAAARIGLPASAVIGHVHADSETGVQVLRLHGTAPSATLAARIANAAAHALSERVATIVSAPEALRIEIVDPAVAPSAPASPRRGFGLLLGALVGLLVGALLALAYDRSHATGSTAIAETLRRVRTIIGPKPAPPRAARSRARATARRPATKTRPPRGATGSTPEGRRAASGSDAMPARRTQRAAARQNGTPARRTRERMVGDAARNGRRERPPARTAGHTNDD